MDLNTVNTNTLAFIGDGIYEVFVRKHVIESGNFDVNRLHKESVKYVKAPAQCFVMKKIQTELSEEEERIVKRARNHKQHTKAKNSDIITYKWATAFEALIGYLYYKGDFGRMRYLIEQGIKLTEESYE